MATTTRNIHKESLAVSSALAGYYVKNVILPIDVIRVLNAASVRYMLVGAHGIGGWLGEARTTQDVDVLVGYRQHQKALRALLAAYPQLQPDDQEVVVRLTDPETGNVLIDVMKSVQPLHREGLRHTQTVEAEGQVYRVPDLEMALALKFGPMVSPMWPRGKKVRDTSDFIIMVERHADIDLEKLAKLGELVYPGGGKEIIELVRKVRAGEKLTL
jgi:hypothetical protein